MKPTKLMKVIGEAEDEYILSAMASRTNQKAKRNKLRKTIVSAVLIVVFATLVLLFVGTGCDKKEEPGPVAIATAPLEVDAELLANVSITLPEGISRETVSNIQHDFIQEGKQVGGIVVVDIPKELLDSPRESKFEIAEFLRNQIMPNLSAEEAELVSWGGDQNAYMELITGPDEMAYFHYLFRGVNNTYDVWFNMESLAQDSEIIQKIVDSVAGEDILPENNQSPF